MKTLTGPLNEKRLKIVKDVFYKLDLIDGIDGNTKLKHMVDA
jgi:hypothetical protein